MRCAATVLLTSFALAAWFVVTGCRGESVDEPGNEGAVSKLAPDAAGTDTTDWEAAESAPAPPFPNVRSEEGMRGPTEILEEPPDSSYGSGSHVLRTGARRASGLRSTEAYVKYKARDDVDLSEFRQARTSEFAFGVERFKERQSKRIESGFHVEGAGTIVALALALQLEHMGFEAGVLPADETEGAVEIDVDLTKYADHARLSGTVEFLVEHQRNGENYQTTAKIEVNLNVHALRAGSLEPEKIYTRTLEDDETLRGTTLAKAGERARAAASTLLARTIKNLLGDSKLDEKLADHFAASRP